MFVVFLVTYAVCVYATVVFSEARSMGSERYSGSRDYMPFRSNDYTPNNKPSPPKELIEFLVALNKAGCVSIVDGVLVVRNPSKLSKMAKKYFPDPALQKSIIDMLNTLCVRSSSALIIPNATTQPSNNQPKAESEAEAVISASTQDISSQLEQAELDRLETKKPYVQPTNKNRRAVSQSQTSSDLTKLNHPETPKSCMRAIIEEKLPAGHPQLMTTVDPLYVCASMNSWIVVIIIGLLAVGIGLCVYAAIR